MAELVGLVREFPNGSLFVLISLIWAAERVGVAIASRNRPVSCNCSCCNEEEETKEEE